MRAGPAGCGEKVVLLGIAIVVAASVSLTALECPTADCDPSLLGRRALTALRLTGPPPAIDGRLSEAVWSAAPVATDFVESLPRPAARAALRSEARVLVDETAIYVGLRYYDPEPGKILAPVARRDDETTSDWAFIEIDSRHDRRSGFSFGVNPRGVQVDGLWSDDINYDPSWNAVWEAAAQVDATGWTVEARIPFSQLAFSLPRDARELLWGINFYRYSPGHGEKSNWSPRYHGLGGVVSQFNDLHVPAPQRVDRLEVTPYLAPRLGNDTDAGRRGEVKAGAGLKVGLGSSFNLTATVLPDFGQVEADPSQVNLTAFELFQPERRPFFLEGIDVFRLSTSLPFTTRGISFADESPFYSRRVGRPPQGELPAGAETTDAIPNATTLLAAAKLSGQTTGGWTLGVFSALTDSERARLRLPEGSRVDLPIESRATTTVARAIRSFDHGDSSFGLFAADLHRFGLDTVLAGQEVADAAVFGSELQHRFGGSNYELRSWALASRLAGDEAAITRVAEAPQHYFQRPDAPRLHDKISSTSLSGVAAETRISRIGGAFLWDLVGRAVSPGFDVDEIGFQRNSDWLLVTGTWKYERFTPGHAIRGWSVGSSDLGAGWTWAGESRARVFDAYVAIDTRAYWNVRGSVTRELSGLSTDWLRGGPALLLPPRTTFALSIATDQRKASYATLDLSLGQEPASDTTTWSISPLWNVRLSDLFQGSVGTTYEVDRIGWQYVGRVDRAAGAEYIVGRVRQETLSFTTRADLTFSPRLALQIYLQPFASVGRYDDFKRLVSPRDPVPSRRFAPIAPGSPGAVPPAPDAEERSLNGSLVLRWEYFPGSFLTVAWNHQRAALFSGVDRSPGSALSQLLGDPPINVLLVKVSRRFGA